MRNRRFLALYIMLVLSMGCPPPPPPEKGDIALIFADVTNSLVSKENEEIALLTAQVLSSFPGGTKYTLYPILRETHRPPVIKKGEIFKNEDANQVISEKLREEITQKIQELYISTNKSTGKNSDNGKEDENRTCILNTLSFAENHFKQFNPAEYNFKLIFISDMIEECNDTPLNQVIKMDKADIVDEISLAEKANFNIDLSPARVVIIIPSTYETTRVAAGHRPGRMSLEQFWANIFKHCNFSEDMLNDPNRFYFHVGLPDEFAFAGK